MRRRGDSVFGRPSTISERSEDLNQTDRNFTVDTSEAKMMMGPATVRDRMAATFKPAAA